MIPLVKSILKTITTFKGYKSLANKFFNGKIKPYKKYSDKKKND